MTKSREILPEKGIDDFIRESEGSYREIFNAVNDAIFIHDMETGKILYVNENMQSMYGYTLDEIRNMDVGGISSGEEPYTNEEASRLLRRAADEGPQLFEWHSRNRAGELFWTEVNLKKGTIGGREVILAIERDITERKRMEEEREKLQERLLEAGKMESLGILAGGVAHDFNNLLQIIYAYTEILMMKRRETDQGLHELEIIEKTVTRATGLINQLLLFSRKADSEKKPLLLNNEITVTAEMLKRTLPKMINLELKLDGSLWQVNADPAQINQVLLNLANNAADSMPSGGNLVIETENVVLDDNIIIRDAHLLQDKYVQLTVSDTGRGISAEKLHHVFDPFFTTKEPGKGTGLGLASVYGIVKSHDGHIYCYSQEGEGSAFVIYLPAIIKDSMSRPETEESETERITGKETILIVDDEEDIVNITSMILEEYGYTTIKAKSGEEALEYLSKAESAPQLALLDLGMPGMGGYKCLTEIRKNYPGTKVLVASGYALKDAAGKAMGKGASGFLRKPYNIKKLTEKIREVLE